MRSEFIGSFTLVRFGVKPPFFGKRNKSQRGMLFPGALFFLGLLSLFYNFLARARRKSLALGPPTAFIPCQMDVGPRFDCI